MTRITLDRLVDPVAAVSLDLAHMPDLLRVDHPSPSWADISPVELLNDPTSVACAADHTFCRDCVDALQGTADQSCPTCREPVFRAEFRKNGFARRLIRALPTFCQYSTRCAWTGDIQGLDVHADSVSSPFAQLWLTHRSACTIASTAPTTLEAARHACPAAVWPRTSSSAVGRRRNVNARCGERILAKDVQAHRAVCAAHPCRNEHCTFYGTLDQRTAHKRHCDVAAATIEQLEDDKDFYQEHTAELEHGKTELEERIGELEERQAELEEQVEALDGEGDELRADLDYARAVYNQVRSYANACGLQIGPLPERRPAPESESDDGSEGDEGECSD